MKTLIAALLLFAAPAFASVTVTSPLNNAQVDATFMLAATASPCEGQSIASMAYSIDHGPLLVVVRGASLNQFVSPSMAIGAHSLHVKSWGNQGASCVADLTINTGTNSAPVIPSTAKSSPAVGNLVNWKSTFDIATAGSTYGQTRLVPSPTNAGTTVRQFVTDFTNNGGNRYSVPFGVDVAAMHFLYDGWVYIAKSSGVIANLELDINQVLANGQTLIFGFQCSGWANVWEYTINAGTPTSYKPKWLKSTSFCNPHSWTTDVWHHVQILFSRDNNGNATYRSVWLDGVKSDINATVPSSFALRWGTTLVTNFQVDGMSDGQVTLYLDRLTIYRW